jgi:hypothetical protein
VHQRRPRLLASRDCEIDADREYMARQEPRPPKKYGSAGASPSPKATCSLQLRLTRYGGLCSFPCSRSETGQKTPGFPTIAICPVDYVAPDRHDIPFDALITTANEEAPRALSYLGHDVHLSEIIAIRELAY